MPLKRSLQAAPCRSVAWPVVEPATSRNSCRGLLLFWECIGLCYWSHRNLMMSSQESGKKRWAKPLNRDHNGKDLHEKSPGWQFTGTIKLLMGKINNAQDVLCDLTAPRGGGWSIPLKQVASTNTQRVQRGQRWRSPSYNANGHNPCVYLFQYTSARVHPVSEVKKQCVVVQKCL